ncbi:hypothetical protein P691DRAFT_812592, partial [Macrolepiota fuliginosa MF-IS2]
MFPRIPAPFLSYRSSLFPHSGPVGHDNGKPDDATTSLNHYEAHAGHMSKRRKALLIGINYTTVKKHRLLKAQSDVDIMKNLLVDVFKYKPEDITCMTDDPKTPANLIPTDQNIIQQMINLVIDPKEGDEFFIYYAGHAGQRGEQTPGNERDKMDEHVIPLNAMDEEGNTIMEKVIDDDRLEEILVQPLIHKNIMCQLIAVMDSCTSGTLLDLKHDLCNNVIGIKSLFVRMLRSLLETSPETNSIVRARIAEWLKDPLHDCNRLCNRKVSSVKANVICISACEDSQTLVESQGAHTLAGILDDYLRRHNKPTLKKLNRFINKQLGKHIDIIQKSYNTEMRRAKRGEREPPLEPPHKGMPQISSSRPLRMNTTLKL